MEKKIRNLYKHFLANLSAGMPEALFETPYRFWKQTFVKSH